MPRACNCDGVFARAQQRFSDRMRDRRHDSSKMGRRQHIEVHEKCEQCGALWELRWKRTVGPEVDIIVQEEQ